jgi:hypothetical protein
LPPSRVRTYIALFTKSRIPVTRNGFKENLFSNNSSNIANKESQVFVIIPSQYTYNLSLY